MSDISADHPLVDWRDAASYAYVGTLSRDAWAWEFLRRNPVYRTTWHEAQTRSPQTDRDLGLPFGLIGVENPNLSAREAKPLWRRDASAYVLPLHATGTSAAADDAGVELMSLCDRAARHIRTSAVLHLLFLEEGRRLQVAIRGGTSNRRAVLTTPAPVVLSTARRRLWLLHRLTDFLVRGRLAPSLYPPDPRSRRLALVLQALDGWQAQASQQTIAQVVFAHRDVHADWRRPAGATLRHQIRRMIRRGRWLMESGYRHLLS